MQQEKRNSNTGIEMLQSISVSLGLLLPRKEWQELQSPRDYKHFCKKTQELFNLFCSLFLLLKNIRNYNVNAMSKRIEY